MASLKTTLKFSKLRYKNLLSTGNLFTEIDLDSVPMTLVVGINGDGKSTMIDAICFALFKKPFRRVNLPQLVNSITKKELVVEVEFLARGHRYKVVRGIKPAVFEVWKDGDLLNQPGSTVDYQTLLEKQILRTNFKTFSQIVILGSANYTPFMQLKPHERRPIVEDIYDLGIITKMNSVLNSRLSSIERDVNALENTRDMLLQKLELSRKHQDVQAEDKQKWIGQKTQDIANIETKVDEVTEQLRVLNEECKALEPDLELLKQHETRLRKMGDLRVQIEAKKTSVTKEVDWLNHQKDCPTCKQSIAEEFKEAAIAEKTQKIVKINEGLSKLKDEVATLKEAIAPLEASSVKHGSNKTQEYVLYSQISTHRGTIAKLRKEIVQLEAEHEEVVDEAQITEIESDILEKKREWGDLVRQRELMGRLGVYLKDTGVKAKIIKKYSGKFNELVNAYLAKLDFFVDFHLDEAFEETIKSRGRDNFSYNSFSEGEKLRIDLAVLFAWRDIAKHRASLNTNLLIMDEIFDGSMDFIGVDELLKIMKGVTVDNNVFVISHNTDKMQDHFDRTLRFKKSKGFSSLES